MIWKHRPHNKDEESLLLKQNYSKLVSRLLSQRSITANDADKFLSARYSDISHPHSLKGVKEAVDLFLTIAKKRGRVAIVGDFDVDGIVSSVMIKDLCICFGLSSDVFLPSRKEHGYGLNPKSIDDIKKKFASFPDLLFILDCGANSEKEIIELKNWSSKTKIIILDHHIIDPNKMTKSADVFINWHLCDYQDTCACGEVFQFIRGIRWVTKKVNPVEYLPFAALGILADVSPIIGDNRIIVRNGLKEYAMKHLTTSGLSSLLKESKIYSTDISQEDILFKIAPRINAVGRLEKPNIAFNLLIEQNPDTADLMARCINERNVERRRLQKEMESEAMTLINANSDIYPHGIFLYKPTWTVGMVGLVASRLAEKFFKPAIVTGQNGDLIKGSGRSLKGVNLKEILDLCPYLFDNYGGHAGAAGVTMNKNHLHLANRIFNDACKKYFEKNGRPEEVRYYDAIVRPDNLTLNTVKELLKTLYPYCNIHNPEPVFLMPDVTIRDVEFFGKENRMLSFNVERDGVKSKMPLRSFSDVVGTELNGLKANICVSLPQTINANPRFRTFLNVVNIEIKK